MWTHALLPACYLHWFLRGAFEKSVEQNSTPASIFNLLCFRLIRSILKCDRIKVSRFRSVLGSQGFVVLVFSMIYASYACASAESRVLLLPFILR
jgi:hypothetical protein